MCTNKAVTCPKVTIGFSTLLMLGMIISLAVINSMFGDNMECYATATDTNSDGRRKMSTDMNYIAAQNPIGDDFARVKLGMSNIAKSVGLAPYMKQLPFARDNVRRLAGAPPNDDSCDYANDGTCDDGGSGTTWYAPCDCGTDVSDCGVNRNAADCIAAPPPPPYSWGSSNAKTAAASQAGRDKVEKDVLGVMNPLISIPAILCWLFLMIGSVLTLQKPACCGMTMLTFGTVFSILSFALYAACTYFLLLYLSVIITVFKNAYGIAEACSGSDAHAICKCIDDTQKMLSSTGVGCLICTIACMGAFVASICASCGICTVQKNEKNAGNMGTQMASAVQGTAVPVAQPSVV